MFRSLLGFRGIVSCSRLGSYRDRLLVVEAIAEVDGSTVIPKADVEASTSARESSKSSISSTTSASTIRPCLYPSRARSEP
ncbi:hypothetical protein TIFTF001_032948 [Ficus carica]|uniref:Uncharacterized protein n=1 Tax=Ficus carica TaxID=3494 RepID=A0AA88DY55_FICCA|nr:hypothetical protein TIFTF001_032948 [Ficus carica]